MIIAKTQFSIELMPVNKNQHFVPQHYLRQFRIEGTNQLSVARINPLRLIDRAPIDRQCQQDYFYKDDGQLDDLLQQFECDVAPVLRRVSEQRKFDPKELAALRFLAVILDIRTRKAVELAKVFPKKISYEVIKSAIERGELREPEGGWKEEMMDFTGVAGTQLKATAISSWLEMQTLGCKLLEAEDGSSFVTSDNPVVKMNQLFATIEPYRSFVGFSRSGFQLLLPIAPHLCLFFYDPKVYKVGSRRENPVTISRLDVDLVNSLQLQSAEKCIYFHSPEFKPAVFQLVMKNASLRLPVSSSLREFKGESEEESILHIRQPSPKLRHPWAFCKYHKKRKIGEDNRRDPEWSNMVEAVVNDLDKHPGRGVFESMEEILGCPLREADAERLKKDIFCSS
ncbi:DUF4238 domain-containing protein [Coraliomargarita sp. SDUM461003]|uniref:DUF4238 domain-containing protein n=1 Tax=Thalassobacterium maritimum TaxID=3041265 RepID=A0ABU1AV77_9BACT|nr:DUF4238 domain-containing protein [Coraliomargarita sp. SDUM461003]MDQ8207557.1 DUF4238 domain-containing protein [Coraliomargarita sp. SDUM461003]